MNMSMIRIGIENTIAPRDYSTHRAVAHLKERTVIGIFTYACPLYITLKTPNPHNLDWYGPDDILSISIETKGGVYAHYRNEGGRLVHQNSDVDATVRLEIPRS